MTLETLNVPRLTWNGTLNLGLKGVISFSHVHHMVERCCLWRVSYIPDTRIASPPFMDSIWGFHKFIDVFPTNLHGVPLDRDIEIAIKVELDT